MISPRQSFLGGPRVRISLPAASQQRTVPARAPIARRGAGETRLAHLRRRRAQTDWSMCFALSVPLARSSFSSHGRTDQGRLKVLPKGESLLTEIRRFESRSLRQRLSFSQFRGCTPQRPHSPARCTGPAVGF
jgi:hypothetical protein